MESLGMGLQNLMQALSLCVFDIWMFWASGPVPHMAESTHGTWRCGAHQGLGPNRKWGAHSWMQDPTLGSCASLGSTLWDRVIQHMVS